MCQIMMLEVSNSVSDPLLKEHVHEFWVGVKKWPPDSAAQCQLVFPRAKARDSSQQGLTLTIPKIHELSNAFRETHDWSFI